MRHNSRMEFGNMFFRLYNPSKDLIVNQYTTYDWELIFPGIDEDDFKDLGACSNTVALIWCDKHDNKPIGMVFLEERPNDVGKVNFHGGTWEKSPKYYLNIFSSLKGLFMFLITNNFEIFTTCSESNLTADKFQNGLGFLEISRNNEIIEKKLDPRNFYNKILSKKRFLQNNRYAYKWGYLRENSQEALRAGIDKESNLNRTGLDVYLKFIYPEVTDWIHDKPLGRINGKYYRYRPDYRSESKKLIVEFDGLPHYKNPDVIFGDRQKNEVYKSAGYKVVRIPYFIQLSNEAISVLFERTVDIPMFDECEYPSLGINGRNTPAFLCPLGIYRMAADFLKFPNQLKININQLISEQEPQLTGLELLLDALKGKIPPDL